MRTTILLVLGLAACSGGKSGDDGPGTGDDGETTFVPTGADCVPDDAAGTTWDESATTHLPVEPLMEFVGGEFNGRLTRVFMPEHAPRGVVVSFEGTKVLAAGDGIKETTDLEWLPLYNELVQAGFGIALTEANPDPDDGDDWDLNEDPAKNDDIQDILDFLDDVAATTTMEPTTPLLLESFSGAGNFVNIVAPALADAGWDVRAASIHDGATWGWHNDFPTIWVTQQNEWVQNDVVTEEGPGAAYEAYEGHIADGNRGLYLATPEIPMTPSRMMRDPRYDTERSQWAFDELVRLGIVDEAGERLFDIHEYDHWEKVYVSDSVDVYGPDIVTTQLDVVWGAHRYNGVHAIEECGFLIEEF